jgi:hypothetical protein
MIESKRKKKSWKRYKGWSYVTGMGLVVVVVFVDFGFCYY